MLKGKRADITDTILIVITIFFLAVSFVAVAFVNSKMKLVIEKTPLNDTSVAGELKDAFDNMNLRTIQIGFTAIFAFLIIGMMVSSFLVRMHPVFVFIFIIFAGVGTFLAVILGNAYHSFSEITAIASVASQQTQINWIMEHIVVIMIGADLLGMIFLFSKIGGDNSL